jgi:hypothetical protein
MESAKSCPWLPAMHSKVVCKYKYKCDQELVWDLFRLRFLAYVSPFIASSVTLLRSFFPCASIPLHFPFASPPSHTSILIPVYHVIHIIAASDTPTHKLHELLLLLVHNNIHMHGLLITIAM